MNIDKISLGKGEVEKTKQKKSGKEKKGKCLS